MSTTYKPGDRVTLTKGIDRGREGVVQGTQGVAVIVRLLPQPNRTAITLHLRPTSIRKATP